MIGLPASGKSTFTARYPDACICSADQVRAEWFGKEELQYTEDFLKEHGIDPEGKTEREKEKSAHPFVWGEVKRRAMEAVAEGKDVIIDGTNTQRFNRKLLMEPFRTSAQLYGIWINTPPEVCIKWDAMRSRHVGEEVIRRHAGLFEEPTLEEGFQVIEVYDQNGTLVSRKTRSE